VRREGNFNDESEINKIKPFKQNEDTPWVFSS